MGEILKPETNRGASRIDKAIVKNLSDIEKTFKADGALVFDLIAFLSSRMFDMFDYSRFTLNDFCETMGKNKQDLCMIHPLVASGAEEAPERNGHKFETVFDFVLYRILERKIIFTKAFEYKDGESNLSMSSFEILKDLKLNFRKSSNQLKIYDVRVGDELLTGFLKRYYTFDMEGIKKLSKGRSAFGKKKLFTLINALRHTTLTQNNTVTPTPFAVNYLASIANIETGLNKSRKLSLKRYLDFIKKNTNLKFNYEFVSSGRHKYEEDYHVKFEFSPVDVVIVNNKKEHYILMSIYNNLSIQFKHKYNLGPSDEEKDYFQEWLNNPKKDIKDKLQIIVGAYQKEDIRITENEAMKLIISKRIGAVNNLN